MLLIIFCVRRGLGFSVPTPAPTRCRGLTKHLVSTRAGPTSLSNDSCPPLQSSLVSTSREEAPHLVDMEAIVNLCRKRGFVFGSSEIYNGFNGFYDYGPMGVELKRNIKNKWWRDMVQERDDVFGLDASIISSPLVWGASGHVAGFSDPMCDDKKTKKRYRADQLVTACVTTDEGANLGYVTVFESDETLHDLHVAASKAFRSSSVVVDESTISHVSDLTEADFVNVPPPDDPLRQGDLTYPRAFNLMFETKVGALDDSSSIAYLRPETAQGIFVNFKNVANTARGFRLPCGIAQIGKAFRNEITPRNFIFRSREFEQMEIEYFVPPEDWNHHLKTWIQTCTDWLVTGCGLRRELLGFEVHDKLAHYAKACTDITFKFPFGVQELQGVAARGDFDLLQHQTASGKSLEYFDDVSQSKFLPHVIEPSIGVDRLFLAILCSAYSQEVIHGETRTVLKVHPSLAPVKCAVLPLVKSNDQLLDVARGLHDKLKRQFNCDYDASGAIGRRYRRQDETGTPFCVTVDFESLEDGMVTVRDRDTMHQRRVPIPLVDKVVLDAVNL